ncbi:nitrilase-related carbon-nitrogen hydrolase [Aliarcobacter butzleri]|uniref:nitrilase-related carbon-nitrogen hydrolase n=1 Tax=Aliarcobacter butzleri TaxID=28197 RepID=UPI003AFB6CBE
MKIALASLNQFWEDKNSNIQLCEKYIQNASSKKVDLIIFPEMTLTGFSNNIDLTSENFENSETIEKFSNFAKEFNIAIIFGVVIKDNKKALNKCLFIDNFGNVLSDYSKIHPFSFSKEDKYFNAGNKLSAVEFKNFKIGLTICYDLRFPELYSSLAKECDLIINIANWPSKRVDHWNTLLKARSIENQIFMVGVNRTGIDGNGLEYIESSNIFNANGEELEFEKYEDMKIYDIDVNFIKDFKNKFNTVNDRKVEFYKEIL